MKVFKFYKNNCAPCYVLSRTLMVIDLPKDIEIINKNVGEEENKAFAKNNGIDKVPTLMFENGRKLILPKNKLEIIEFLKGGLDNAVSN